MTRRRALGQGTCARERARAVPPCSAGLQATYHGCLARIHELFPVEGLADRVPVHEAIDVEAAERGAAILFRHVAAALPRRRAAQRVAEVAPQSVVVLGCLVEKKELARVEVRDKKSLELQRLVRVALPREGAQPLPAEAQRCHRPAKC